jgi:hypothetical protein
LKDMLDLIFLALGCALFAGLFAYASLCGRA